MDDIFPGWHDVKLLFVSLVSSIKIKKNHLKILLHLKSACVSRYLWISHIHFSSHVLGKFLMQVKTNDQSWILLWVGICTCTEPYWEKQCTVHSLTLALLGIPWHFCAVWCRNSWASWVSMVCGGDGAVLHVSKSCWEALVLLGLCRIKMGESHGTFWYSGFRLGSTLHLVGLTWCPGL